MLAYLFAIIFVLAVPVSALGQNAGVSREERITEARKRIEALARTLRANGVETVAERLLRETTHDAPNQSINRIFPGLESQAHRDTAGKFATADRIASQIKREVDQYVATLDVARIDAGSVLADLKEVLKPLGDQTSLFASMWKPLLVPAENCNPLYLPPRNAPLPSGPYLILAFMIWKEFNQSTVTLRVYRATSGHFVLSDTTGQDFENYTLLSTQELYSNTTHPCEPAKQRTWFLLSGQVNTANGPNIRMRAFSFDGRKLQTVWMPENAWGDWRITVKDGGFFVDGNWYRGGARHEEYAVADDGFYRSR